MEKPQSEWKNSVRMEKPKLEGDLYFKLCSMRFERERERETPRGKTATW